MARSLHSAIWLALLAIIVASPAVAHPRDGAPTVALPSGADLFEATSPMRLWWVAGPVAVALFVGPRLRRAASAHRFGKAMALGLAVAVLTSTTQAAPHLVHHALDPDDGSGCAIFQIASHTDGSAVDGATLEAPDVYVLAVEMSPSAALSVRGDVARSRAPPSENSRIR